MSKDKLLLGMLPCFDLSHFFQISMRFRGSIPPQVLKKIVFLDFFYILIFFKKIFIFWSCTFHLSLYAYIFMKIHFYLPLLLINGVI